MSWWQRMAMNTLLAFLHSTIKNPKSLGTEGLILDEIRDAIDQIRPRPTVTGARNFR